MSNIKFNTNRKNISDQQALRHKSFDKVMAGYKALSTPFYKTFKFWAGAGAAVTIAVVATLLITGKTEKHDLITGEQHVVESAVKPPFAELDIPSDTYLIDAGKDTVIITKTGSQIKIAANSFTDETGKLLTGKVEIKYREFHDVVDFFMSGIPMDYDSAGTQYHFESAGMFEIHGFQEGKEAVISAESPINVLLASTQEGERFNIYKLDDKSGDWSFEGKDMAGKKIVTGDSISATTIVPVEYDEEAWRMSPARKKLANELNEAKAKTQEVIEKRPVEPKKVVESRINLAIEVNPAEYPELASYKNVLFELDKNDTVYKSGMSKQTWSSVDIKKGKENGTFILTFTKAKESYSFLTRPVYKGTEYDKAVKEYNKKFDEYETALAKRKDDEIKKQKELEAELVRLNAEREVQLASIQKRIADESARIVATGETTDIIYRSFMVSSFGIWNSDCPQNLPKGVLVSATFTDKNNKQLTFTTLYLVEKGKNAAYALNNYDYNRFQFNPASQNLLMGVTKDNKIALFKPEEFAALGKIGSTCIFKMDVMDKKFKDINEVRTLLDI